MGFAVNKLRFI